MAYTIEEGYDKIRDVDKSKNDLAQEYNFSILTGDIDAAHELIQPNNTFLAITAEKINEVQEALSIVQSYWTDKKNKVLSWFNNIYNEVIEIYNPNETYDKGVVVLYNDNYYMCMQSNVTGTFNINNWRLLQPNGVGVNLENYSVQTDTGTNTQYIEIKNSLNVNEIVATTLPTMVYLAPGVSPLMGMVYISDSSGYNHVDIIYEGDILYPETSADISVLNSTKLNSNNVQNALTELRGL